jgi:hypothetical protein
MIITTKFLKEKGACEEGYKWVKENKLIGLDSIPFVNKLIENDKLGWANWLIVRCMEYKECVSYAVYAAEQVIDIFEKKYPNDKRPRKAIEAAKACLDNPSDENKKAADASAYASASAAYASASAAYAAADAAAAYAYAAAYASAAAYAYAAASAYAKKEMRLKILNYGLQLLENRI